MCIRRRLRLKSYSQSDRRLMRWTKSKPVWSSLPPIRNPFRRRSRLSPASRAKWMRSPKSGKRSMHFPMCRIKSKLCPMWKKKSASFRNFSRKLKKCLICRKRSMRFPIMRIPSARFRIWRKQSLIFRKKWIPLPKHRIRLMRFRRCRKRSRQLRNYRKKSA